MLADLLHDFFVLRELLVALHAAVVLFDELRERVALARRLKLSVADNGGALALLVVVVDERELAMAPAAQVVLEIDGLLKAVNLLPAVLALVRELLVDRVVVRRGHFGNIFVALRDFNCPLMMKNSNLNRDNISVL